MNKITGSNYYHLLNLPTTMRIRNPPKCHPFPLIMVFICASLLNPKSSPGPPSHTTSATEGFMFYLHEVYEHLMQNVKHMQDVQAKYYDAKYKPIEAKPRDLVWLNFCHSFTMQLSKKPDWKHLGTFKVVKCIGFQAYKLGLPALICYIHNTFYISLLDLVKSTLVHLHRFAPAPLALYIEDDHDYFKIEDIQVFHRIKNLLQYLIKWKRCPESDNSWEPIMHILAHSLIKEFHQRNPTKPGFSCHQIHSLLHLML